jgi:hypothetical protein
MGLNNFKILARFAVFSDVKYNEKSIMIQFAEIIICSALLSSGKLQPYGLFNLHAIAADLARQNSETMLVQHHNTVSEITPCCIRTQTAECAFYCRFQSSDVHCIAFMSSPRAEHHR